MQRSVALYRDNCENSHLFRFIGKKTLLQRVDHAHGNSCHLKSYVTTIKLQIKLYNNNKKKKKRKKKPIIVTTLLNKTHFDEYYYYCVVLLHEDAFLPNKLGSSSNYWVADVKLNRFKSLTKRFVVVVLICISFPLHEKIYITKTILNRNKTATKYIVIVLLINYFFKKK